MAPPSGELSSQVTERVERRQQHDVSLREHKCRGRPPDVPQHKRKCRLYKAGRCPTRRETARWISLRASGDAAPYTHTTPKRTDVGDGLRTFRALNNGIIFTSAPKVRRTFNIMSPFPGEGGKGNGVLRGRIALSVNALSVNALRHCHLSRGERQGRSNVGVAWACLGSPFGGAVTAGD